MILSAHYRELSPKERWAVREEYIRLQENLCYHCGAPLDEEPAPHVRALPVDLRLYPTTFFKHPVHLHHNHSTGLTLGAVHNYCNAVLWEYQDE